jgi:hypothetical protein
MNGRILKLQLSGGTRMLKKVSLVFGVVFTLVGLLGFVPGVTSTDADGHQLLLGLFMVDAVHNLVHLASGVVGLAAAASDRYAKLYLVGFGGVYALVTLIGFFTSPVLGFLHVNTADNWLHLVLAVGLLGAGLGLQAGEDMDGPAKKVAM